MTQFRLTSQAGADILEPTPDQVRAVIAALEPDPDNYYAIIERVGSDRMEYMQVAIAEDGGFLLEYQDGSLDAHFQHDPVGLEDVVAAFVSYMRDDTWRRRFPWRQIDLSLGFSEN
jgi:hypothetical protein